MIASVIAVPSLVMRCASQSGTRPPCNGRTATPERFMGSIVSRLLITVKLDCEATGRAPDFPKMKSPGNYLGFQNQKLLRRIQCPPWFPGWPSYPVKPGFELLLLLFVLLLWFPGCPS